MWFPGGGVYAKIKKELGYQTLFEFVDKLFILIQFQFVDFVNQTFNITHTFYKKQKWKTHSLYKLQNKEWFGIISEIGAVR